MQVGRLYIIGLSLFLTSCNFTSSPKSNLTVKIKTTTTPFVQSGVIPSDPKLTDFWRGALIVDGPDFNLFQVNFSVENQHVIDQDIEFEIPAGINRTLGVVLIASDAEDGDSPFDVLDDASHIYFYTGDALFNAEEAEVTVPITLKSTVYQALYDPTEDPTDSHMIEVHIALPDSGAEDAVGALSSAQLYNAHLFGAVTEGVSEFASMRLPRDMNFDFFGIPTRSKVYDHTLLDNLVINIPKGNGRAPIVQNVISNLSPKSIGKAIVHNPGKAPKSIASYQYAVNQAGTQIFVNPSAANSDWLSTTDFDNDGYGLGDELAANSDPFSAGSVPGSLLTSFGGIIWGGSKVVDDYSAHYHGLDISFAQNGDEFGMITFIRSMPDITQRNENTHSDTSLYTLPITSVPSKKDKATTGNFTVGTLSKSLPDTDISQFRYGDVFSFDTCLGSSNFGILVSNNYNIFATGELLDIRISMLANKAFSGVSQTLEANTDENIFYNYAYDVNALCDFNGTGGFVTYSYGVQSDNTFSWGVRLAHLSTNPPQFIVVPTNTENILFSDIGSRMTPDQFAPKPFATNFITPTKAFITIAQQSTPKIAGITGEGSTIAKISESGNRSGYEISQMHNSPLGQVISGNYTQGVLNVYVEKSLIGNELHNQLQFSFFDGATLQSAVGISAAAGTGSSIKILEVTSYLDIHTKRASFLALVLYRLQLQFTNELHVATIEYKSNGDVTVKEDTLLGKQETQTDFSYVTGSVAFLNNVQGLIVYNESTRVGGGYRYKAMTYNKGTQNLSTISTDESTTENDENLLIDVSMVGGAYDKIVVVYTICSETNKCDLRAVTAGVSLPTTPELPPRNTNLFKHWF